MAHRYLTADVFTDRPFGGNPLAVFPDGEALDGKAMQAIAGELNLSETVFVLPPTRAEAVCRLRIFTPGAELPFAGHPTVGAAHVLASIGRIPLAGAQTEVIFEEGVGPVPVRISAEDGVSAVCRLTTAQPPEALGTAPAAAELEAMLGLEAGAVASDEAASAYFSCGVPFLFVPLRSVEQLGRIRLDTVRHRQLLDGAPSPNVFAFAAAGDVHDWRARMFAPGFGIAEDPATGSAVAAFAGWLARRPGQAAGRATFAIGQGIEMGRPSTLMLEAEFRDSRAVAVHVGGRSVIVSEGAFRYP